MLNAALVEQVGQLHRQRSSGVLTVVGNGFRLRFCLLDGDPVAMDFGANKGVILARTLLEFHFIDSELHRHLISACESGQNVTALVRQQQAASEEEIALVTRAMVEDTLCRCFGSMHYETVFEEGESSDTFDYETTSVRLRIAADTLLNTVQQRVNEIDTLNKTIGGGGAVYALAENEGSVAPLSDYEKHILNFIDGHKTVEDLATAFRESVINISRHLKGMVDKGVLRRVVGIVTRTHELTEEDDATAQKADGTRTSGVMSQVTTRPQPGSGLGLRLVLTGILAVVCLVAVVKILHHERTSALDDAENAFNLSLSEKRWVDALKDLGQAQEAAGNDMIAQRHVKELKNHYDAVITGEYALISDSIAKDNFTAAQLMLERLPPDDQSNELRARRINQQSAFKLEVQKRRNLVAKLLDQGQIKEALASIAQAPEGERIGVREPLEHWRLLSLERASSSTAPLRDRTQIIAQIISSQPDPHQMEQIERITSEFKRIKDHSKVLIKHLDERVAQGDYQSAADEFDRLQLDDQLRGTEVYGAAQELHANLDRVRGELTTCASDAQALLRNGDDAQAMTHKSDEITALLQRYPAATNTTELAQDSHLLIEVAALIAQRSASDEVSADEAWLADHRAEHEVGAIMTQRIARLRAGETAAEEALTNGRTFLRDHNWDEATRAFTQLLEHNQWRRTSAYAEAGHELEQIKSTRNAQQSWQEELDKALLAGDIAACYRIQGKMGLKYLPVLVSCVPAAQVWQDGKQVGVTPMKLDIPAGERGALVLELRKAGFVTSVVHGSQAESGWLLQCSLEHETSAHFNLGITLTAPPTALDGKLWVANRKQAVAISVGTKPINAVFEQNGAFDTNLQPLYAAPSFSEGVVYYPTREGLVLKILPTSIERIAVSGRSDFALAVFSSQVIVSRRFLILAGKDGVLHANAENQPQTTWKGINGKAFAAAPFLIGDQVLALRSDGHVECYQADDGRLVGQYDIGSEPLAVWSHVDHLCVLTGDAYFDCDVHEAHKQPLPQTARTGGEDLFITYDKHVFIRAGANDQTWTDVGTFQGTLTGIPRRWNQHAVLPLGSTLSVMGPHGFQAHATSDFLSPSLLGDQLAVCTVNGDVRIYAP